MYTVMVRHAISSDTLFFEPSLAVDAVLFTLEKGLLKVLLIERDHDPYKGLYALPGGFLQKGESASVAVSRILRDKAGVRDMYLEQLYTFDKLGRDPRGHVVSVVYYALVPQNALCIRTTTGAQTPTLYSVRTLPPLAFDHREIVRYAVKRLRAKIGYTNAALSLLPRRFTLASVQQVYEVILNRNLDKRNFHKKFLALEVVRPTGEYTRGLRQRPAQLYEKVSRRRSEFDRAF